MAGRRAGSASATLWLRGFLLSLFPEGGYLSTPSHGASPLCFQTRFATIRHGAVGRLLGFLPRKLSIQGEKS